MRSSQAVRTAGWLAGLAAALWMTAGGAACAATASPAAPASAGAGPPLAPAPGPCTTAARPATGCPASRAPWPPPPRCGPPRRWTGRSTASRSSRRAGSTWPPRTTPCTQLSPATGKVVWSRHLATPVPAPAAALRGHRPDGRDHRHPGDRPGPARDLRRRRRGGARPARRTSLVGLSTATGQVEMTGRSTRRGQDPARAAPADRAEPRPRPRGVRLRRQLRRLRQLPRPGGVRPARPAGRRPCSPSTGSRPVAGRGLDGRRRPGRRQRGPRLGQRRQRLGDQATARLRRQRFGARTVALDAPAAVLRAGQLGGDNASDLDLSTAPALLPTARCCRREVRASPTCSTAGTSVASAASRRRPGPSAARSWTGHARSSARTVYLPCLTGPVAVRVPPRPRRRLSVRWRVPGRRRAADRGGRPGLDDRPGRVLYGLDPGTGHVAAGPPQLGLSTDANHFPTPSVGARPPAGPGPGPGRTRSGWACRERGSQRPPGQHGAVGARQRASGRVKRRAAGRHVRRRRCGHRGGQPGGTDRPRLAGVAPHAEPALTASRSGPAAP